MDDRDDLSCGETEEMDQSSLDDPDFEGGDIDLESIDLDFESENIDLEDKGLDFEGEEIDLEDKGLDFESKDIDLEDKGLDFEGEDIDLEDKDLDRPEGDPNDLGQKTNDIHSNPDFLEWSKPLGHLDDQTLQALWKDIQDRSPREVELVDAALHPEYESQKIFLTNETGKAMQDEQGNWITETHRISGSQAPDGFFQDPEGVVHLREQKNYTNASNLMRNITEQTASRRAAFGDDVDITYTLAPNFTVQQAEKIQAYCEDKLGVSIEWQD